MTLESLQAQVRPSDRAITEGSQPIASSRPTPEIRSHQTTPGYWVASQHEIEAVDRTRPMNMAQVCVELWHRQYEVEVSLILTTNNDSFVFVAEVIKQTMGDSICITGIIDRPEISSTKMAIAA